jgi:hypothetical protein
MNFEYFVIIDQTGHAGLAATKRAAAESELAEHGGRMVAVRAANAFLARRQANAVVRDLSTGSESLH